MTFLTYLHDSASMYSINVDSIELLQALCDKTRLRILRLLVSNPQEEACLCEFSDSIQEPEYNVSRHLKVLRQAGLVSATKEGRWVYHRLVTERTVEPFYELVSKLGDPENVFKNDAKRFRSEIKKRTAARCVRDGASASKAEDKKGAKQ